MCSRRTKPEEASPVTLVTLLYLPEGVVGLLTTETTSQMAQYPGKHKRPPTVPLALVVSGLTPLSIPKAKEHTREEDALRQHCADAGLTGSNNLRKKQKKTLRKKARKSKEEEQEKEDLEAKRARKRGGTKAPLKPTWTKSG